MATADPRYDITDVLELALQGLSDGEKERARALVFDYARRLDRVRSGIVMLRVAVERPQGRTSTGNPYRVRVRATAPGHVEVVAVSDTVDHDPHDTLQTVIKSTFRAVERQLRAEQERQRNDVKRQEFGPALEDRVGIVLRVLHDEGYGFLRSLDGREVYFHENAVLHGDFQALHPGATVRFEDVEGDDGPQATTVQVIGRKGHRPDGNDADEVQDPEGWRRDDRNRLDD